MTIYRFAAFAAGLSLATVIGACVSHGASTAQNRVVEESFRTQGTILAGIPPRPAANVEVMLADLAPEHFSPMGPGGPIEFSESRTITDGTGHFTIKVKRSSPVRHALRNGSLGLKVIGHKQGIGLIQLKMQENPTYVIPLLQPVKH